MNINILLYCKLVIMYMKMWLFYVNVCATPIEQCTSSLRVLILQTPYTLQMQCLTSVCMQMAY